MTFTDVEPPALDDFPSVPGTKAVDAYAYTDEVGDPLFYVVRYEPGPDGERKTFRQWRKAGGKWKPLGETRRVLYRLPQVQAFLTTNSRDPLYICEGEKDVHTVERLGAVATTGPMGAGKWIPSYAETLQGVRTCVILADRDQAGIPHAVHVKELLGEVGVSADILLPMDGCKDITDHIESGYGWGELRPLLEEPPEPGATVFLAGRAFLALNEPHIEPLMGTSTQAVLAAGGLLILGGEAGTAKTTLTLDVLAHICSGRSWMGIAQPRPIRVCVIENEGPRSKFKEKLEEKVKAWPYADFIDNVHVYADPWGHFSLAEEPFRNDLTAYVRAHHIDLVVADPLGSLGVEGVGAPDETRRFVAILKGMGLFQPTDPCAYWFPHHYGKHHVGSVIQQLSGDWGGHADTVIGVRNEGKQRTHLTWAKVRWASELQGDKWVLEWVQGASFDRVEEIEEGQQVSDAELWQRISEYILEHGGPVSTSRLAKEVAGNQKRITELVKQAGDSGLLRNIGTGHRPQWVWPDGTEQEGLHGEDS